MIRSRPVNRRISDPRCSRYETKRRSTYPRQRRFVTFHGPKLMPAAFRRVLSAFIVLAIGGLAALPFYRPAEPPPLSQPAPSAGSTPSIPITGPSDSQVGGAIAPTDSSSTSANPTHPLIDAVIFQPGNRLESELHLTRKAPQAEAPVPPADPIAPRGNDRPVDSTRESTPADLAWRSHRIVDGDTLEKLARRMLGDPQRWPEIRMANSDILTEDGVLPIGKLLRIPPRTTPPANDLVPIPWPNK